MAKLTKQQLIDEIFAVYEKCVSYHKNELKELYENGHITAGCYWYLLSPTREYCFKSFFGDCGRHEAPMFGHTKQKRVKIWDFEYTLKKAQEFLTKIEEVIELKEYII